MESTLAVLGTLATFSGWGALLYRWNRDANRKLRDEWHGALRDLRRQLVQTRILYEIEQRFAERLARETESRPATVKAEVRDHVDKDLGLGRPLSELTSPSNVARRLDEIERRLDGGASRSTASSPA